MKTIGIIGGGQLAQLLAHSAYALRLNTLCYAEDIHAPAARNSALMTAKLDSRQSLEAFAKQCAFITLENENIPTEVLSFLSQFTEIYPPPHAIGISQDRLLEKQLFTELHIPTVSYQAVNTQEECHEAAQHLGAPCILKTRRNGYDGRGQLRIRSLQAAQTAWDTIGHTSAMMEAYLDFDYEVSLLAVSRQGANAVFYPLVHNTHQEGILQVSRFPYIEPQLQAQAEHYASQVLKALNYTGLLAFEFFVKDKQLYANELAPRVHNSGHLTIEGATCSQFENHLRAIAGLPIIAPQPIKFSAMINVIGEWPPLPPELMSAGVHVYDYGKSPRPGRKLGHITLHAYHEAHLEVLIAQFKQIFNN